MDRDSGGKEFFERLDYGGLLWYRTEDGDRVMSGFLRSSNAGNLALINLLSSGKRVFLDLHGTVLYYRESRVKSSRWYTKEHPDVREELESLVPKM